MALHVFAIGRIDRSGLDIVLSPQQEQACSDAYTVGEMDFDDGRPNEPLLHYSDLASIEAYLCGWKDAQHGAEMARRHVPDWQAFLDYGALLDADAAAADRDFGSIEDDHDFIRGGC